MLRKSLPVLILRVAIRILRETSVHFRSVTTISAPRTSWWDCSAYLPSVTKVTPSGETRSAASLPLNPVRYRIFVIRRQRKR